jgi:hypothetical protein
MKSPAVSAHHFTLHLWILNLFFISSLNSNITFSFCACISTDTLHLFFILFYFSLNSLPPSLYLSLKNKGQWNAASMITGPKGFIILCLILFFPTMFEPKELSSCKVRSPRILILLSVDFHSPVDGHKHPKGRAQRWDKNIRNVIQSDQDWISYYHMFINTKYFKTINLSIILTLNIFSDESRTNYLYLNRWFYYLFIFIISPSKW